MIYTGSCYQGPLGGQMMTHDATRKEFFSVDPEINNGDPAFIGAYVWDGYDLWKWEPADEHIEPRDT